ncbi:unnamed protein product [Somion occarium]|uniref:Uncharacterized protein n=1 Tax=Somion occarium TaxID=3059160 RepID=A0ABP1DRU2_9APHY
MQSCSQASIMLPLSQSFTQSSTSQSSLFATSQSLNFPDISSSFGSQTFGSQTLSDLSLLGSQDVNSPETFKQNIILVLDQLTRVQSLVRSAIAGIEHAYRPGTNPIQTSADIVSLRQAVDLLQELLRHSGVGALPLLDPQNPELPTEQQLLSDTNKVIRHLFDHLKRIQDSSAVVANLLGAAEQHGRR